MIVMIAISIELVDSLRPLVMRRSASDGNLRRRKVSRGGDFKVSRGGDVQVCGGGGPALFREGDFFREAIEEGRLFDPCEKQNEISGQLRILAQKMSDDAHKLADFLRLPWSDVCNPRFQIFASQIVLCPLFQFGLHHRMGLEIRVPTQTGAPSPAINICRGSKPSILVNGETVFTADASRYELQLDPAAWGNLARTCGVDQSFILRLILSLCERNDLIENLDVGRMHYSFFGDFWTTLPSRISELSIFPPELAHIVAQYATIHYPFGASGLITFKRTSTDALYWSGYVNPYEYDADYYDLYDSEKDVAD